MSKNVYHKWADIKAKLRTPEQLEKLHHEAMEELVEMDLRSIREISGKTQGEVAAILKTAQSEISRMESRADYKLSRLRAFAEALGGQLEVVVRVRDRTVRLQSI